MHLSINCLHFYQLVMLDNDATVNLNKQNQNMPCFMKNPSQTHCSSLFPLSVKPVCPVGFLRTESPMEPQKALFIHLVKGLCLVKHISVLYLKVYVQVSSQIKQSPISQ